MENLCTLGNPRSFWGRGVNGNGDEAADGHEGGRAHGLAIHILPMINVDHLDQLLGKTVQNTKRTHAERPESGKLTFQLLTEQGIARNLAQSALEVLPVHRVESIQGLFGAAREPNASWS